MAPKQGDSFLHLPISVVSRVDVGRLLREVDGLDDFLKQSELRAPGTPTKLPRTSRLFDEVVNVNQLNVLHEEDRSRLKIFLTEVRSGAPTLHMSFSADPSPLFTQKLISWLRSELHPVVLLQVGLQPNIGAGCVVRTTNKYFDFSLRSRFKEKGPILADLLKAGGKPTDKPAPVAVEATNG